MKANYKKIMKNVLFCLGIVLTGCTANAKTNTSSSEESLITSSKDSIIQTSSINVTNSNEDLMTLKEKYGEFNIITTKGSDGVLSSDGKTYTITVSASKSAYTISGYFDGQIVIKNNSNLATFKGVELTLSNACLITYTGSNIDYQVSDKNIEIVARKGTENYIINLGEGYNDCAVNSEKNIEVDGKGILHVYTKTGHGLRAENKVKFYDSMTVNITSGHDAIHSGFFVANNEEALEIDYEAFTGTLNILSSVSQAFDCTTSLGTGSIDITSGTFNISNCESAFKVDVSLYINGQVSASNLLSDPVVRGANSNGVTIEITSIGSFTVDNNNYTKTNI